MEQNMTTLETAKIAFDTWRAERINTHVPFPATLWEMARQLLETHKKTEVYKTLRISSHQIKRFCKENLPLRQVPSNNAAGVIHSQPQQISTSDDFVAATPASQGFDSPNKKMMSMLTLTSNNKTLQLSFPTSALADVLPALGALL